MKRVIAGGCGRHGTGIAFSSLPFGYEGPARMTYVSPRGHEYWVVFPSRVEASLAANFAIQCDCGGYQTGELSIANADEVTHESCLAWIQEDGSS